MGDKVYQKPIRSQTDFYVENHAYRSIHEAAWMEALIMIYTRYTPNKMTFLSIKEVRGIKCSCTINQHLIKLGMSEEISADQKGCPLHDYDTGYLSRLWMRLVRLLKASYTAQVEQAKDQP